MMGLEVGHTAAALTPDRDDDPARLSEVIAGRLAADMDELLRLAPKEVKLSEIAAWMREMHEGTATAPLSP